MKLEPVDLREINKRASNIYEAIIVASKRARQVNDEIKLKFTDQVSMLDKVADDDDGEDLNNPQQAELSLRFEKMPKPHLEALKELLAGDVNFRYAEEKKPKSLF